MSGVRPRARRLVPSGGGPSSAVATASAAALTRVAASWIRVPTGPSVRLIRRGCGAGRRGCCRGSGSGSALSTGSASQVSTASATRRARSAYPAGVACTPSPTRAATGHAPPPPLPSPPAARRAWPPASCAIVLFMTSTETPLTGGRASVDTTRQRSPATIPRRSRFAQQGRALRGVVVRSEVEDNHLVVLLKPVPQHADALRAWAPGARVDRDGHGCQLPPQVGTSAHLEAVAHHEDRPRLGARRRGSDYRRQGAEQQGRTEPPAHRPRSLARSPPARRRRPAPHRGRSGGSRPNAARPARDRRARPCRCSAHRA